MDYLYKSVTGKTENIGSYVVSATGAQHTGLVPELDAMVGTTLSREVVEYTKTEEVAEAKPVKK